MKFYLISDNVDTMVGLRLAGIPGEVVHERDTFAAALENAAQDAQTGVILVTEKLSALFAEQTDAFKLSYERPLLIAIPDRHGSARAQDSITRYVREAIGLKL